MTTSPPWPQGRIRTWGALLVLAIGLSGFGCGLESADSSHAASDVPAERLIDDPELAAELRLHRGDRGGPLEARADVIAEAAGRAGRAQAAEPTARPGVEAYDDVPVPDRGGANAGGDRDNSAPQPLPDEPYAFISIDERLQRLSEDLAGFDNAADRQRMRYLDFSNLANRGLTDAALEPYRQALSLLLNSLSQGESVVVPRAIDEQRLFYRIDLRDYAWSAATWDAVIAGYPYAVRYDQDSSVLPYDERIAELIRDDTGSLVPYVQADWFLAQASSAPRYYEILGVPANVLALTERLGVDVAQNIRDAQVVRAGFNGSAVALNNRVVERHELPGGNGALFLTYDFFDSVDRRNVYAHPTDFLADQSEGLFTLPNGLHGYFLADASFRRVNRGAAQVGSDAHRRDRAVQAGISCMGGCHLAQGVLPAVDAVRDYVVLSAPDGRTIDETLSVYKPRPVLSALIDADQARYAAAIEATGFRVTDPDALNRLVLLHEGDLDVDAVAAVLGIRPAVLIETLDDSPQVFPPELLPLRNPGTVIQRATLDVIAGDIVEGLSLGTPLRP